MNIRLILGALLGAALLSGMGLLGPLAREAKGDFILWNDEQLIVNTGHSIGTLYDQSQAHMVKGETVYHYSPTNTWISAGSALDLYAYDSSFVDISGGYVYHLYAYNSSSVALSDGWVGAFSAYDSSSVNMSGGSVGSTGGSLYAYNSSSVNISAGSLKNLRVYDSSSVNMTGGLVSNYLDAHLKRSGSGSINISGGTVGTLSAFMTLTGVEQLHISENLTLASLATYGVTVAPGIVSNLRWDTITAYGSSSVDISGGSVGSIYAYDSCTMDISGGSISSNLYAYGTSTVTFLARDFHLGNGLSVDGDRVRGTGYLSGEWLDGTRWTVNIGSSSEATILAIPEPATLWLLALGGLALLHRRRGASS